MPGKTNIGWTDDSWNPTTGCTRVSAGCDHCYAFALHDQRHAAYQAGRFPDAPAQYHKPFSEVQLMPARLEIPLRQTRPRRIFVDSMADLFHADVPEAFLASVFAVMGLAPQHQFQVLTKRPQRMWRLLAPGDPHQYFRGLVERAVHNLRREHPRLPEFPGWPLPNVWLGTSVEDQAAAYRTDWLLKTPAAVRFLSCEPLLGPIDLDPWLWEDPIPEGYDGDSSCCPDGPPLGLLHWVIAGGESGPDFRPVDLAWVRDLRDQCQAASVAFFYKQQGGRTPKAGGRELDGRTWDQFPAVAS